MTRTRTVVFGCCGKTYEADAHYVWHDAERRTRDYPGAPAHAEIVNLTDINTGAEIDGDAKNEAARIALEEDLADEDREHADANDWQDIQEADYRR